MKDRIRNAWAVLTGRAAVCTCPPEPTPSTFHLNYTPMGLQITTPGNTMASPARFHLPGGAPR